MLLYWCQLIGSLNKDRIYIRKNYLCCGVCVWCGVWCGVCVCVFVCVWCVCVCYSFCRSNSLLFLVLYFSDQRRKFAYRYRCGAHSLRSCNYEGWTVAISGWEPTYLYSIPLLRPVSTAAVLALSFLPCPPWAGLLYPYTSWPTFFRARLCYCILLTKWRLSF